MIIVGDATQTRKKTGKKEYGYRLRKETSLRSIRCS